MAELYPSVAEYAGREVEEVEFVTPGPFDADTLQQIVETEPSGCSFLGLPFCIPFTDIGRQRRVVEVTTVASDAARLAIFYRRSGYFGTTVEPEVEPVEEEEAEGATSPVLVRFTVDVGSAVYLDSLSIVGLDEVADPEQIREKLPLDTGELFDLTEFDLSADTILNRMLQQGYAYAEVLRNYDVHLQENRAVAELIAVPGPRVLVDSIVVLGAGRLGRQATLRQITVEEGSVLRASELVASQRNLYGLELVQFASVDLAPDSLQIAPDDSTRATVIVRVAEAPVHVVEAAVGFGTVECLRTQARWTSRSFPSGAQRLSVTGSVSKLGLAGPANVGLGRNFCRAFEGDPFQDQLDYRLAADFTRPYFYGPSNQLNLGAHLSRQSEPGVFQRTSQGTRAAVSHRIGLRDALTGAVDIERGQTVAATAIFCLALQVCRPEETEFAERPRWRNRLTGTYVRDRTERLVNPRSGTVLRTSAEWATPLLLSDLDFVRLATDGIVYRRLRETWTGAGFLRLGTVLGSSVALGEDFLPPEDRFFTGGANSVRGYGRNELGPGVWVTTEDVDLNQDDVPAEFIPAGGTSVVVASAEVRFPSPVLQEYLRMAVFVDAGAVDTTSIWKIGPGDLAVTPGVGLRLQTPVGPVRFDVAYNPNALPRGPLFVTDEDDPDVLIRVRENFAPARHGIWDRLRFHIAVGQAF